MRQRNKRKRGKKKSRLCDRDSDLLMGLLQAYDLLVLRVLDIKFVHQLPGFVRLQREFPAKFARIGVVGCTAFVNKRHFNLFVLRYGDVVLHTDPDRF